MTQINKKVVIFENGKTPMRKVNESLDNNGKKLYILEGVCASFDGENNNGRTYDKDEYLKHFDYLLPQIEQRALAGSLDHPEDDENEEHDIFTPKMKDLSHLITKLWYNAETNEVWIQIQLLDTNWGRDAMACVDAGMPIFISSRASGYIADDGRVTLDQIHTYDIVYRPGFAKAKLTPVVESFESKTSYTTIFECQKNNITPLANPLDERITRRELNRIMENFRSSITRLKKVNESLEIPETVTTEILDKMDMKDDAYLPSLLKFLRDTSNDLKVRYDYVVKYATEVLDTPIDAEADEATMTSTIDAFIENNEVQYITDDDRVASVSESLLLANKNIKAIKECLADCSPDERFCMVKDFVDNEVKPEAEKLDLINTYLLTFDADNRLKLADVPEEDLIAAFSELDEPVASMENPIVDQTANIQMIYRKLATEIRDRINSDNITIKRVNSITDYLSVVATEFNALTDRFDNNISSIIASYQKVVNYCSVLEQRVNTLTDYVDVIATTVNDSINASDINTQRVNTLTDYASAVASAVNALSDDVDVRIESVVENKENNKKITESLDTKISQAIDAVIKTKQNVGTPVRVNENARKQRVFESGSELKVPARYQNSWNRLDNQQKNEIVCLFEMRQPRTSEEVEAIWESLDLGRKALISTPKTTMVQSSALGYDDSSIDASLGL